MTRAVKPLSLIYGAASRNWRSSASSSIIAFIISIRPPRCQCPLQFLAAAQHISLHRAERDVENACSFVMRQAVLAAEHNGCAVVQRKQIQGLHKIVPQTRIDSLRILLCLPLLLIHTDEFLAATRIFAKTVVRNTVKPCGKSRFTTKAADVLVSANKGLLSQVVCQGNICAGKLPQ